MRCAFLRTLITPYYLLGSAQHYDFPRDKHSPEQTNVVDAAIHSPLGLSVPHFGKSSTLNSSMQYFLATGAKIPEKWVAWTHSADQLQL